MATSEGTTSIGFIGLGHMGGNMAARFLAAGYTVYGEEQPRRRTAPHGRGAPARHHSGSWGV